MIFPADKHYGIVVLRYKPLTIDDSLPGAVDYTPITHKALIRAFGDKHFKVFQLPTGQYAVAHVPSGRVMGGQTMAEALDYWQEEIARASLGDIRSGALRAA